MDERDMERGEGGERERGRTEEERRGERGRTEEEREERGRGGGQERREGERLMTVQNRKERKGTSKGEDESTQTRATEGEIFLLLS